MFLCLVPPLLQQPNRLACLHIYLRFLFLLPSPLLPSENLHLTDKRILRRILLTLVLTLQHPLQLLLLILLALTNQYIQVFVHLPLQIRRRKLGNFPLRLLLVLVAPG